MSQTRDRDYVLGTHDEEIARLGLQHSIWRSRALDAWRRAGFTRGDTILDVGCGPGYAALDLADLVGPAGRVVAVDRSRRFLDTLEAAVAARGAANVEVREGDLDEISWPALGADGAWVRWVFSFVREPRRLLERVVDALRPGGTLVVHEYLDYRTWRASPRRPEFEAFVQSVMTSWRADGGEPDIGMELPRWLSEMGVELRELRPLVDVVRRRDHLWHWPTAFIQTGAARLRDLGHIDEAQRTAIVDGYARADADPHAFQVTPMVIEILAVRR